MPAPLPRNAKSPRPFAILAIGGPIVGFVTFILMQLSFTAATDGSFALIFEIIGLALFVVWLACIVATVVGIIGVIVRLAQNR
jgi:urea transporter